MFKPEPSTKRNDECMPFTGCEKVQVQKGFFSVRNSFTYELWVKPEADIQIQTESNSGWSGIEGQKFVIGAEQGRDEDEAGVGLSIGRNGVAVYEHSAGYLPAVLVFPTSISGWIHIAVVYHHRTPSLYVNGVFARQGSPSGKSTVHASSVFGGLNPYGSFVGELRELRLWDHARSEEQIRINMNQPLTGNEPGLLGLWKFTKRSVVQDMTRNCNHGALGWSNYMLAVLNDTHNLGAALDTTRVVDVIIPIYNSLEETQECIESVFMNSDLPYNLYLINDCSSDKNVYSYLNELHSSAAPNNLRKLEIIHNESNEGFVRSANKGMALSQNDVILLNSDTEVPREWMSRLMSPFALDENIASVTPFSNSATICSFPDIFRDNPMPPNMTTDDVDEIFRTYGTDVPIELPTAVGFCMAIRREVLNQIGLFDEEAFGMGYGEENDWCMRAKHVGRKSVLVPNLFVFHKGASSFAMNAQVHRESQQQRNFQKLLSKHPSYLHQVQRFTREDPARVIRESLSSIIATKNLASQKGVLFLLHNTGGGTEHFQNHYIENIKNQTRVYRLQYGFSRFVFSDLNHAYPMSFSFDSLNQQMFRKLLSLFDIRLIHVDHLISFPFPSAMDLIQSSGVDYTFHIHDYFSVCPRINLLNHQNVYCHDETDATKCQHCMNHTAHVDIQYWRQRFSYFLEGAKQVIAPSTDTKRIIQKYYPRLAVEVQSHSLPRHIHHTFSPRFVDEPQLNIGFIGGIGFHKGSRILYQLRESIRQENLPINIKVIGTTEFHHGNFISDDGKFLVTGAFQNQEISDLLAKHKISVVVIPSICPETYSYATSEAMYSGYPVITFNIGAPPSRVMEYDAGWIAHQINSSSVLSLLKNLLQNRREILRKAGHLRDAFHSLAVDNENYRGTDDGGGRRLWGIVDHKA